MAQGWPPEIALAATVQLSTAQQAFRQAACRHRLDSALPRDIWFDHGYGILPSQRSRPLARNGSEQWFHYTQVVKRAVDPRKRRHVAIVSGGLCSGVGRHGR